MTQQQNSTWRHRITDALGLGPCTAPEIARHVVHSRAVAAIGYDSVGQYLHVEYINGALYRADNVGAQDYDQLLSATAFDSAFEQVFSRLNWVQIGRVTPICLG